jgi:hypothetical protein
MMSGRRSLGVVLGTALVAACAAAEPAGPPSDEQTLKAARVGTDGPALLAYFRQRTVGEADRQRIEGLIRQLGDPAYATRERAAAELVAAGLPAVGPLRQAQSDPDIEIARRAERCLQQIERVPSTTLSAAAARLVARQKPAGAVGVLLAYLPLADDETVADEVREALAAVALAGGRPDPLLEQALEDALPVRRGAAAEALIRTGRPDLIDLSRKSLADGNLDVRLRAALALVTRAKDRRAVPALIDLLAELPQGDGWRAEEVLIRLAGEAAAPASLGSDEASRQKYRDAWLAWWERSGAAVDLAKLDGTAAQLGYTLVVLRDPRASSGRVVELDAKKEVVWKIDGLQMPTDAVVVGRDRVLIAEQARNQVSERTFAGVEVWKKTVPMPTGLQRLPNSHTLITSRNQIVEWDADRREVFNYQRNQFDIVAAQKLRTGEVMFVTQAGACVCLDAKGRESKSFQIGRLFYMYGGLDILSNGRLLVTQRDGVAEFEPGDRPGPTIWSAACGRPTSVQRLPNGNTLVATTPTTPQPQAHVVELDRSGQTVWEYKPMDGTQPWRARRR